MSLKDFKENGYIIKKKLLNDEQVKNMLNHLDKFNDFSEKDYEPCSKIPYIYDKILEDKNSPFYDIINDDFIKKISNDVLEYESRFSFLKVNNKSKYIGQDICYHQEFAVSKYQGLKENDSIQIFIALEPHTLENGCLKIIEKSHKYGEIEHEDFFDPNYNHKLRIPYEIMEDLTNKYNLKNCILEPGDCLIFNQFLVHGSNSNKSQYGRKAIVGWIVRNDFIFDEKKNKEFWKKRQEITLNSLESKIKMVKDKLNSFSTGMKLLK